MVDQICLNSSLLDAIKEVFETMIFMDIEEVVEPGDQIQEDTLLSSITFNGNLEGCLSICGTIDCLKTIAINMLGMEPDDYIGDGNICDAIGEVTNMIMGRIKSRITESFGDIQVSVPLVVRGHHLGSNINNGAEKIVTVVNLEDEGLLEISLLYRNPGR